MLSDFIQTRREKQIAATRATAKREGRQKFIKRSQNGNTGEKRQKHRTIHKRLQKNKGITNRSLVKYTRCKTWNT